MTAQDFVAKIKSYIDEKLAPDPNAPPPCHATAVSDIIYNEDGLMVVQYCGDKPDKVLTPPAN